MFRGDIKSTDQAIDTLVYQLYGLAEKEIEIVEGKISKNEGRMKKVLI